MACLTEEPTGGSAAAALLQFSLFLKQVCSCRKGVIIPPVPRGNRWGKGLAQLLHLASTAHSFPSPWLFGTAGGAGAHGSGGLGEVGRGVRLPEAFLGLLCWMMELLCLPDLVSADFQVLESSTVVCQAAFGSGGMPEKPLQVWCEVETLMC